MKSVNINTEQTKQNIQNTRIKNPTVKERFRKWVRQQQQKKINVLGKTIPLTSLLLVFPMFLGIVASAITTYYIYTNVILYSPPPSTILKVSSDYIAPKKIDVDNRFMAIMPTTPPEKPRTEESPLNGKLFTKAEMKELKKRRPIATMINNHPAARPQSNLSSADLVFETVVEAGITRYMTVHWSNQAEKLGPIRSARQYYLEWLNPLDPLYVHDGYAHSDDPKVNAAGNIYAYGIKDVSTHGAWRDHTRYAPHNEYSSTKAVWDYAKSLDWDGFPKIRSWKFKADALEKDRGNKTHIKVTFWKYMANNGHYDSEWEYDKITNSYLHSIGDKKDIDAENNNRVKAKTVIVQEVEAHLTMDSKGHVIVTTIDKGDSKIFMDGKIYSTTWKKNSRTDRTIFYKNNGDEFEFNRGLIWIMAVPRRAGDLTIIEK